MALRMALRMALCPVVRSLLEGFEFRIEGNRFNWPSLENHIILPFVMNPPATPQQLSHKRLLKDGVLRFACV